MYMYCITIVIDMIMAVQHLDMYSEFLKILFWRTLMILQLSYLRTPPLGQDMTQGQFLSGV